MKLPKDLGGSESFGMRFPRCAYVCEGARQMVAPAGGGVADVDGIVNYCISVCW